PSLRGRRSMHCGRRWRISRRTAPNSWGRRRRKRMDSNRYRELAVDGLWRQNPALVQLLGLCPLLAVSDSVVKALGLGLATVVVLALSNLVVALVRIAAAPAIRLPLFALIFAALASAAEMLMHAYAFGLFQ